MNCHRERGLKEMWLEKVLHLPNSLWDAYRSVLTAHNLLSACTTGTEKKNIYGGATQVEAEEHFVYRFANSASRTCYLVQPESADFIEISTALAVSFASKDIHVLDLAAGTGAGVLGILSSIAELRSSGGLPKLPLNVHIYAADISDAALTIYAELLTELEPTFASVALGVSLLSACWDASETASTNVLCNDWLASVGKAETLVLVSNLSGVGKALLDDFKRSLQHITERVSHLPNTLLWVEPQGKSAKKFLEKVAELIFKPAKWFVPQSRHGLESKYKWRHEIQLDNKEINGSVQLLSFKRSAA